jgi:D-alanyl-D-alanine endopeptidase (penicillin-binding protein 7)
MRTGFQGRRPPSFPGWHCAAAALALACWSLPSAALAAPSNPVAQAPLAQLVSTRAQGAPGKVGRRPTAAPARSIQRAKPRPRRAVPPRPSVGQLAGLRSTGDELDLRSSVALVVDEQSDEVLFSKNPDAVLPIASITKLMTAMVVVEAGQSMTETLTVTPEDLAATSGSRARSRLKVGTQLTRGEMLRLALMASENRAAHVLGRSFPGGVQSFVRAMNERAKRLGMEDTRYVEPTGLSSDNRSSAQDLARLVRASSEQPLIREYSTSPEAVVPVGSRQVQFRNTNGLVRSPHWDIVVQKTGYIAAAGRCVVMQAEMAGRQLIMVLLDSAGRYSRIGDAERLRRWLVDSPLFARLASRGSAPAAAATPAASPAPAAVPSAPSPVSAPVSPPVVAPPAASDAGGQGADALAPLIAEAVQRSAERNGESAPQPR